MEPEKCLCGGKVIARKDRVTGDVTKRCQSCAAIWTVKANEGRYW